MSPAATPFVLEISPRGDWKDQLFPEQSAEFNLLLRNAGASPASALALHGSLDTPRLVVFNASGVEIGIYTKGDQYERKVGDLARREPPEPRPRQMAPGQTSSISFNIWGYRDALPPGQYAVEAQHQATPASPFFSSNRYRFDIVPAAVGSVALGYDTAGRSASVLAWLASAHPGAAGRLLVRASAPKGHASLMQGATSHGEFPSGSRVSVAQAAHGMEESGLGWLAVVSGTQVTLVRHNLSYPYWRGEPAALPIGDAVPVPRFPDMDEQALFLATGQGPQGPALAGVLVEEEKGVVRQWTVPLSEKPSMAACMARAKRPASLLLVTNHQGGSRITRLDVNTSGKPSGNQKTIRQSANAVLAVAPAANPESGTAFYVLESNAGEPDRVAVVTIPMSGPPRVPALRPLPAWPRDKDGRPVHTAEAQIEEAVDRSIAIAFVDPEGSFYAGQIFPRPSIVKLRHDTASACLRPHVAALHRATTPGCFTAEGRLFTPGMSSEERQER